MEKGNKKKVLFIVSDYLPNKSGGTHRIEKNVKYLKDKIDCFVFTKRLNDLSKYDVINCVEVFRTHPYNLSKYYIEGKKFLSKFKYKKKQLSLDGNESVIPLAGRGRIADLFFVPDIDMFWAFFSVFKLKRIIKEKNIQVVYSSGPSHSNHLIPLLLHSFLKKRNIKWITEFRDPWITNPFRDKKIFPFEYIDNKLEKLVLEKCDKIIDISEKYKFNFIERYSFLTDRKISVIPNGFDSEDFDFLKDLKKRKNQFYTIVSAGSYYQKRSLLPFLQAWKSAMDEFPHLEQNIQFIHFGNIDVGAQLFLDRNLVPNIKIKKSIAHKLCIEEMYHADCLLLIPGPGEGTMPGKTFEYLATGNPILALINDGPTKVLINELRAGKTIDVDAIDSIKSFVIDINKKDSFNIDSAEIAEKIVKFNRKKLAMSVLKEIKTLK